LDHDCGMVSLKSGVESSFLLLKDRLYKRDGYEELRVLLALIQLSNLSLIHLSNFLNSGLYLASISAVGKKVTEVAFFQLFASSLSLCYRTMVMKSLSKQSISLP